LGWVSGPTTKESKLTNSDHSRPLLTAIKILLNSKTDEEATKIIQQHPELLSEEADKVFDALIEQQTSKEVRSILQSYREGLQQFRQVNKGIPTLFQADVAQANSAKARYLQHSDPTGLDDSITAWERILQHPDFTTADADFRSRVLNDSAGTYSRRYRARGEISDLDRALSGWQVAVSQTPAGSPGLPMYLNNLGNGLTDRYARTGDLTDLQAGIAAYQRAVSLTPAGSPELPGNLNNLGNGLRNRYARTGDLTDLQAGIEACQRAVQLTPAGSPGLPMYLNNLGNGLTDRYARTGDLTDLHAGLAAYQRAVQLTPADSPELPRNLNSLGTGLTDRYARTGDLTDLQAGIAAFQQAVQLTPAGSPELPSILSNLGGGFQQRYACTGDLTDLQAGLEAFQRAVQLTPAGSPELPSILSNLGIGLSNRYARTSDLTDLQEGIEAYQRAVQLTPASSPDLPRYLNNLGIGLIEGRHARTGDLTDLQAGIKAYQRAVQLTPAGSPDLPSRLTNLGTGFRVRYARTGDLTDLQAGIAAFQQAVQLTPADSPDLPTYLNNLGTGLGDRYARTGDLTDLQAMIAAFQQVVQLTPTGSLGLPRYLNNLGFGLQDRYARTGDLTDLQAGLEAYQRAVQLIPAGSPDLPSYLNNLSKGLGDRYARTGDLTDLQARIETSQRAVQLTPTGAPELPKFLNNLGTSLGDRYARTGDLTDLQAGLAAFQRAVQLTPAGSPGLPTYLNNLGSGLRNRYARTGDLTDLQAGLENYQRAAQRGLEVNLEESLTSARNWLRWAFERQAWEEVGTAYQFAYQASTRLVQTQLQRADQESWLTESQGLAAQTAYAYAKRQRWKNAVVILERGLAQLLSQALARDRANLTDLIQHGDTGKELSARYQQTTEAWRLAQTKDTPSPDELRSCRAAFEQVIQAIRQVKGYKKFLQAPTWEDIKVAATETPLVYLLTTTAGGLALIVHQQTVTSVALPEFTADGVKREGNSYFDAYQKQRQNHLAWHQAIDDMGQWLWQVLWQPLRKKLPNQQRITLIPVGWLNLLPLHAAWTADTTKPTGRRYALDEVTIAYAPNAVSLQKARDLATHISSDKLLAIDEPKPVKANPLPSSSVEVNAIARHFTQPQLLRHQAATQETVKKALSLNYTVLHFSCHGGANRAKPLETGLLMANNEMLTVQHFLDTKLQARLVTLSACETGIIGTKNIEEVVGLPASLLQAGVAGVAASLWPVAELTTMLLMTQFYQRWRHEYPDNPAEALRQAQQWVRDSKPRQKTEFLRTILPETAAKELREKMGVANYAHPYYWAAFTYVGV
jgi:CHAT domain-containing protein